MEVKGEYGRSHRIAGELNHFQTQSESAEDVETPRQRRVASSLKLRIPALTRETAANASAAPARSEGSSEAMDVDMPEGAVEYMEEERVSVNEDITSSLTQLAV